MIVARNTLRIVSILHFTLLIAWLMGLAMSGLCLADALDDYLAEPPKVTTDYWDDEGAPEIVIPRHVRQMKEAATEIERGMAVGQLGWVARFMAQEPRALAAAEALVTKHVMPNINATRALDPSDACCWRYTLINCRYVYKNNNNREAERECLSMMHHGSSKPGDKELALWLLAYQQAEMKDFAGAIKSINLIPEESKWARHRRKLIKHWSRELKKLEKKAASHRTSEMPKP